MITPKLVALEKQLALALPVLRVKKTLMLVPPVDKLLLGIWFDRSSHDNVSFSVTAFIMPLCIPAKHLGFTFGSRVRDKNGGDRWNIETSGLTGDLTAALKEQALPFLSKGDTLEGFIEIARSSPPTGRVLEGLAYALARSGKIEQAIDAFVRLTSMLDLSVGWQRELAEQARTFGAKLAENPVEAGQQLIYWEAETLNRLKLIEFRNQPSSRTFSQQ
jgi:hypothetical protein